MGRAAIALIGGVDTARRVAVVIPLDDSFPVRAEAAGCLFNALTGRPTGRTPNALTAQQRRRLGLVLRSLDGWLERCSYRQIADRSPSDHPASDGPAASEQKSDALTVQLTATQPHADGLFVSRSARRSSPKS